MLLSILIPTYNDECLKLVSNLQAQAEKCGIEYEIIVVDDGSTLEKIKSINNEINFLSNCHIIYNLENKGRSFTRNYLYTQSKGEWLMYLDSDMVVRNNEFISTYVMQMKDNVEVIYGGYEVNGDKEKLKGNLRYKYEKSCENNNKLAEVRRKNPYKDFHTSNFIIRRSLFEKIKFNENFRYYGYEDVEFGIKLKENSISISHINNTVSFEKFESNAEFLRKTEESIDTLISAKDILKGFSSLLNAEENIKRWHLSGCMKILFSIIRKLLLNNILGNNPNIIIFNIYKILKLNASI